MGSGTFNAASYRAYSATTCGKTTDEVFTARNIHKDLDPKGVKLRESRDSADNPRSTPVIVALDVTGSMGMIADYLAREGLGTLFKEILDKKPITDPHVMFMAVGDANCDSAPLQVSQFEADNRVVEQLAKIWIEHGGGGNSFESYNLPWYFAAAHTEHDSLIKRAKRGYLFTIGDEEAPHDLTLEQIETVTGDKIESVIPSAAMLADAQRKYDVFHIIIKEGDYARRSLNSVESTWRSLLGQHVISLADHKKLSETIIGTMQVVEGRDAKLVLKDYGDVVHAAVKNLPQSRQPRRMIAA